MGRSEVVGRLWRALVLALKLGWFVIFAVAAVRAVPDFNTTVLYLAAASLPLWLHN